MGASSELVARFARALRYPFSPDTIGIRVPDAICYPTNTAHIRVKCACTTDSSGVWAGLILPLPTLSVINNSGSIAGVNGYTANSTVGGVSTPTNLSAQFLTYRVVSWGFRIILNDTNTNAKGIYSLAPFFMPANMPGAAILNNSASTGPSYIETVCGLPIPGTAVAQMPSNVALNAQDLLARGEVVARGVPYLPTAYNMRTTNADSYGTNWNMNKALGEQFIADVSAATATIGQSVISRAEEHRTDGMIGYVLYANGLPVSTQEFTLEYVYHLEGTPVFTNAVVPTAVPSPPGSTTLVETAIKAVHKAGDFFAQGTAAFAGVNSALGTAAVLYGRYGTGRGRNRLML